MLLHIANKLLDVFVGISLPESKADQIFYQDELDLFAFPVEKVAELTFLLMAQVQIYGKCNQTVQNLLDMLLNSSCNFSRLRMDYQTLLYSCLNLQLIELL